MSKEMFIEGEIGTGWSKQLNLLGQVWAISNFFFFFIFLSPLHFRKKENIREKGKKNKKFENLSTCPNRTWSIFKPVPNDDWREK